MTLKTIMTADAAPGGALFPVDGTGAPTDFSELITFYPRWSEADKVTVNAVVIRDDEEGTREVRGDGVVLNVREGRAVRRSIKIDCNVSVAVREVQPTQKPDCFVVGGEIFVVKRILGRDDDLQTVLCVSREHDVIRNENRVG